mgnify:CR=1 FL=1|tara:strand:- start:125 stop:334 length:210 start_codon:yes stop_codon:yes gene_type:complete
MTKINLDSKIWKRNYNLMEMKMAKRLIPGREKAKGKRYSHRPKRFKNSWFCEKTEKWYGFPKLEEKKPS